MPRLDAGAVAVFAYALEHGGLASRPPEGLPGLGLGARDVESACRTLRRLRLLRPAPGRPEELIPVSPDAAAAEVVGPLEAELARAAAHAQALRDDLHSLMPRYRAARREQGRREGFDVLPDMASASAMLTEESARCREEVFSIQPGGGRAAHRLGDAVERDVAMLRRGVRMRTLYQHSARSSLSTQGYVERLTEAGAEYRTAPNCRTGPWSSTGRWPSCPGAPTAARARGRSSSGTPTWWRTSAGCSSSTGPGRSPSTAPARPRTRRSGRVCGGRWWGCSRRAPRTR
ncbi:hypothetical protein O1L60_35740 [Streptomyces diastatochromogenes]|nr:hypothetical protein [Streptomyces diastatochromogenes]